MLCTTTPGVSNVRVHISYFALMKAALKLRGVHMNINITNLFEKLCKILNIPYSFYIINQN